MATIDARNTTMERVRIALAFYRRDMQDKAEQAGFSARTYPYGIEVENEVRRMLGEPLIHECEPWPMLGEPKPEVVTVEHRNAVLELADVQAHARATRRELESLDRDYRKAVASK